MTLTMEPGTSTDESALTEYLRDRDVPCPLCRYNLRGLTGTRCPECGRELRLGVWLAEPRQAAWVTALVPLLLSGGIGALLILILFRDGWPRGSTGEQVFITISFCYFLGSIPLAAATIWLRRTFLQRPPRAQWAIAGAAACAFVAAVILMLQAM